jgi:hypothetical protein
MSPSPSFHNIQRATQSLGELRLSLALRFEFQDFLAFPRKGRRVLGAEGPAVRKRTLRAAF